MQWDIKISNGADSTDLDTWLALGVYDPTRSSLEQELSLIQSFSQIGGKICWVAVDQKPILRCFVMPLPTGQGLHSLGFFAFAPETEEGLLRTALKSLIEALPNALGQIAVQLIAPMNANTWFPYRLRTDEHPLVFDWEPRRDPLLLKLLKEVNFKVHSHYHSIASQGLKKLQEHLKKDWAKVVSRGIELRAAKPADFRGPLLAELHRLSLDGFAENPLFVPISFQAFAHNYLHGKTARENFLYTAHESDGRCIAYALCFLEPDPEGGRKTLVLKTAVTDRSCRQQGLCNALICELCQHLPIDISDDYISALVYRGLSSESFSKHGGALWEHEYILLSHALVGAPV